MKDAIGQSARAVARANETNKLKIEFFYFLICVFTSALVIAGFVLGS
jgi:hypothetical protein